MPIKMPQGRSMSRHRAESAILATPNWQRLLPAQLAGLLYTQANAIEYAYGIGEPLLFPEKERT